MQKNAKQSTATSLVVGPFLSASDGVSLIDTGGLTETNYKVTVIPAGGGSSGTYDIVTSSPGASERVLEYICEGFWRLDLLAADFAAVGVVTALVWDDAGGATLPITIEIRVWPADEFNGLYAGTEVYADIQTLITKLATGFGTAAPDTLQAYLTAMAEATATRPTSWTEFVASTDALSAVRGLGDTHTTSLSALQSSFDTAVAPVVVGSSALSGYGFLSDVVTRVRQITNEPAITPKYTDGDILEFIQAAFNAVIVDINATTDHPVLCRWDLPLVSGTQNYLLPPSVASVWRIAKINSSTGGIAWEAYPGSERAGSRVGYTLEGRWLRLLSDWKSSDTVQILFTPNAEASLCAGTATSAASGADFCDGGTTIVLDDVDDGSADLREDAYVGYILRITGAETPASPDWATERVITGYDPAAASGPTCTINEAWDFDWATHGAKEWKWEVLPAYAYILKDVVAIQAALDILAAEGDEKKMKVIVSRLQTKMRSLRAGLARKNDRFPSALEGNVPENAYSYSCRYGL